MLKIKSKSIIFALLIWSNVKVSPNKVSTFRYMIIPKTTTTKLIIEYKIRLTAKKFSCPFSSCCALYCATNRTIAFVNPKSNMDKYPTNAPISANSPYSESPNIFTIKGVKTIPTILEIPRLI